MYYPNEEALKEFFCSIIDGSLAVNELPPFLDNITKIYSYTFAYCHNLALTSLPKHITQIGAYAFTECSSLALTSIPKNVDSIGFAAFRGCSNLTTLTFKGTPSDIDDNAFEFCTNLTTINVPWAEGAVANAPWGATHATINYNYTGE